jgi:hypothetical protein
MRDIFIETTVYMNGKDQGLTQIARQAFLK